jgi:WW domain-containing oxidoreductase
MSSWGNVAVAVATTLAATVVGGYVVANAPALHRGSNGFGSCTTASQVASGIDARGKIAVVTGASNGIGKETALTLVKAGARVFVPCRSLAQSKALVDELIRAATAANATVQPGQLVPGVIDLNDFATVREFARAVRADAGLTGSLDILVLNAAIMAVPTRTASVQGVESQMGVDHLAHFLLVKLLMPVLLRSRGGARVVCVSSLAHRIGTRAALEDARLESAVYDPWIAYGNAKLANVLHARELHERYGASGLHAFSLHPGGIHTGLQTHVPWTTALYWRLATPFFFKNIPQGAATTVYCALHPAALQSAGRYHVDCNAAATCCDDVVDDAALRRKLWETSERLVAPFDDDIDLKGLVRDAVDLVRDVIDSK